MKRLWVVSLFALACRGGASTASTTGSAVADASPAPSVPDPMASIARAERLRRADLIPKETLESRDERVRVAAVRALARVADTAARELLLSALSDESPEVVRFAAFGLGQIVTGQETEIAAALALRAASLLAEANPQRTQRALEAVADALARSATPEAERALRAWLALERPIAEAAALALGRLAGKRALEEASQVALLDAAAPGGSHIEAALYPFTRAAAAEGPIAKRALELASVASEGTELERRFAVRALGRARDSAAVVLASALARPSTPPAEHAEIARELGRLGASGKPALASALLARVSEGTILDLSVSPGESDVLLAILDALGERSELARPALERLARMPIPASARERTRAVALRCSAAKLLAGAATLNADLRACDPDPQGSAGKLALLFVLDRGKLTGPRDRRYLELLTDTAPPVRQAALRMLPGHRETQAGPDVLARALADPSPGVVATAAEIIAKHPDRASTRRAGDASAAGGPEPNVVSALGSALRAAEKTQNVEVHAALVDATGALGVLGLTAELERACTSDNPTLREHAQRALPRARCAGAKRSDDGTPPAPPPARRLVFETDAGELVIELEPEAAPLAASRLTELARRGFYTGIRVHRSVPGFVVQLGDPGGDGYGGAPLPPLRCELSPDPFEPGSVGIALSGRDTGNSQFFVTFGRFPHLDGEYTRVGRARPGWDRLRLNDRVNRVRVE